MHRDSFCLLLLPRQIYARYLTKASRVGSEKCKLLKPLTSKNWKWWRESQQILDTWPEYIGAKFIGTTMMSYNKWLFPYMRIPKMDGLLWGKLLLIYGWFGGTSILGNPKWLVKRGFFSRISCATPCPSTFLVFAANQKTSLVDV